VARFDRVWLLFLDPILLNLAALIILCWIELVLTGSFDEAKFAWVFRVIWLVAIWGFFLVLSARSYEAIEGLYHEK